MKFFKKHKWFSFAVISFFVLSGVNFYMVFEIARIIRFCLKRGRVHFASRWGQVFAKACNYWCVEDGSTKVLKYITDFG